MRITILQRYFSALFEGDTVALIVTSVFVAFLLLVGFVILQDKINQANEKKRKGKKGKI